MDINKKKKLSKRRRIVALLIAISIFMFGITTAFAETTDKSFTFQIRFSVTSAAFDLSHSTAKISASAKVINYETGYTQSGYGDHEWSVNLFSTAFLGKSVTVNGTVDSGVYGTSTGWNTSQDHKVTIINNDYLPATLRLKGSGTIKTY